MMSSVNVSAAPLFTSNGGLSGRCKKLCRVLNVDDRVKTAEQFNDFFQRECLRPKGKERWELYKLNIKIDDDDLDSIIDACEKLGMLCDVHPRQSYCDYIVIFGTSCDSMRRSCEFVRNELMTIIKKNKNTRIYFLIGSRPLDPQIDSKGIISDLEARGFPCTEEYAARVIWEKELSGRSVSCEFVSVDAKTLGKAPGELKRANTSDTVNKLLKEFSLKPGAMLAVSINPFIPFQHNVLRNHLADVKWFEGGGHLETVGYHINVKEYISRMGKRRLVNVLLDNIARCAYEEMKQVRANAKTGRRSAAKAKKNISASPDKARSGKANVASAQASSAAEKSPDR
jgi:hypothetical protein